MPGHVKRGGTGEPDPDPSPYLFVSYDDKQKDLAKVCTVFTVNNYCTALSNTVSPCTVRICTVRNLD